MSFGVEKNMHYEYAFKVKEDDQGLIRVHSPKSSTKLIEGMLLLSLGELIKPSIANYISFSEAMWELIYA